MCMYVQKKLYSWCLTCMPDVCVYVCMEGLGVRGACGVGCGVYFQPVRVS